MALPDHYTGENGQIKIDGVTKTLATFSMDVRTDVVPSKQIGEHCDQSFPGKKHVTGAFEEVLVTGDNFAMLVGDTGDITTSSLETLLNTVNLDAAAREEMLITTDPTDPTSVKAALNVGDALTTAGSIVIHGTDSNDNYVVEVLDFAAMAVGDGAQTVFGSQIFKTTDFVDIEAALESGSASYSTLKLEGVDGTKTLTLGESTYFDLVGKVVDTAGKYWQLTAPDCFLTGGTFPVGDKNTIVKSTLPFIMKNPKHFELEWTSA